jgi:sigma-54 dependent transcriptional regulator, acetoin dehydrogenase operon transcriptional activator AcoR
VAAAGLNVSEDERRGAQGPAPAQLIRLHRHSLVNVLVVHGTPAEREQIARVFHRESPVRNGPFVRADCTRDEGLLQAALRAWVAGESREPGANTLLGAGRGTLFLDSVLTLPLQTQHLLLEFATRCVGSEERLGPVAWAGRLVVGSPEDPGDAVAAGTFLVELYDCVNKVRIDLNDAGGPAT